MDYEEEKQASNYEIEESEDLEMVFDISTAKQWERKLQEEMRERQSTLQQLKESQEIERPPTKEELNIKKEKSSKYQKDLVKMCGTDEEENTVDDDNDVIEALENRKEESDILGPVDQKKDKDIDVKLSP